MAGTEPIALRLGVGRGSEEGEQGGGLSAAPDGMEGRGNAYMLICPVWCKKIK